MSRFFLSEKLSVTRNVPRGVYERISCVKASGEDAPSPVGVCINESR